MTKKNIIWSEIQRRAMAFVKRWAGETDEQRESQTFWNEFFGIFDVDRREVARFEDRAKRHSTGKKGRLDLFWPKVIAVEQKSKGKDLDDAEWQLSDYEFDRHMTPELFVVSDFNQFRIWNLETGDRYTFTITELPKYTTLFAHLAGYKHESFKHEEKVSREAAELLGQLFEYLDDNGYSGHPLRVFIVRLLFCVFADDTNVWRRGLFDDFITYRTSEDGSDVGPQLNLLFQVLNQNEESRQKNLDEDLAAFPYINGGLFSENIPIPFFDTKARSLLLQASSFDWTPVSPIIFGSLFQSVKDKEARRTTGEHYTSEANILRVIKPLFLDKLEAELNSIKRNNAELIEFHQKLSQIKVLDPACGCGNFLAVAYRELRRLETRTLLLLHSKNGKIQRVLNIANLVKVSVSQFFGIEIAEFPARIAETAMYLVDHLENLELSAKFGQYFVRFPITTEAHIKIGNALRLDWNSVVPAEEVSYVTGNPPFGGHRYRTEEQSEDLRIVWGSGYNKLLDYVTGWYKVASMYGKEKEIRFAFVSTNSISQGEQVEHLWESLYSDGFHLDYAYTPFVWTTEAKGKAHVHVVIEGFVHGDTNRQNLLYSLDSSSDVWKTLSVPSISPYLVAGPEMVVKKHQQPLSALLPPAAYGSLPADGGGLVVHPEDLSQIDEPVKKYLKRFIGSKELINGIDRWCLWMPEGPTPSELKNSPFLKARFLTVRQFREKSPNLDTKELSAQPYRFFHIAKPRSEYIAVPAQVANKRPWYTVEFLGPETIPSNTLYYIDDPTGLVFGLLSSSMYMAWQRAIGGRIKSDPRFGKAVYHSFPFPSMLSNEAIEKVKEAGKGLLKARKASNRRSLSEMYEADCIHPEILKAHIELDRAVDTIFNANKKHWTDEERLAVLLLRYEEYQSNKQD